MSAYLVAIASVALSSLGQLMFKMTMRDGRHVGLLLLRNPSLYVGFFAYGLSAVLWLAVLGSLPLVVAYPLTALNFVFIALAGRFVLHESLSWSWSLGAFLIMVGMTIAARAQG